MNLRNKKVLASKVLNVGIGRITFVSSRLKEIQEAITRQDIKELFSDGAIKIKEVKGRKTKKKRKTRRRQGKIKMSVKKRKQNYVKLTRKLRRYIKELDKQERLEKGEYKELRKKIKTRTFRSKSHLKEIREGKK